MVPAVLRSAALAAGLLLTALCAGAGAAPSAATRPAADADFARQVRPFLRQHCTACHAGAKPKGELSLKQFGDAASVDAARATWEDVLKRLRAGTMPPEKRPRPPAAEREAVIAWIDARLHYVDCSQARDPGRVTIRRLNRVEYRNTIRDLLGIDFAPAADFPVDDMGYGFDNIGDVLSISPLLMEKYVDAAGQIAAEAIVAPETHRPPVVRREAARLKGGHGDSGPYQGLYSAGQIYDRFDFSRDGRYRIRVGAFADQAGPETARMEVRLDDQPVATIEVPAVANEPGEYETVVEIRKGGRRVGVYFVNDYYRPKDPNPENRDRNLWIEFIEVAGPLEAGGGELPETHRRLLGPELDAEQLPPRRRAANVLKRFAARAWRRPVDDEEVGRLVRFVELAREEGESFERGLQLALQATLVSPHFLFRGERDPRPDDPAALHPIGQYELASRLSYFLWSSMPDEELFDQAARGTLGTSLPSQVRRMLADPRARSLVENFGGQWLETRSLQRMQPDPQRFPEFDAGLRDAMREETERFFAEIVREDRSVLDFLDAPFTFVNGQLARHYGLAGVRGDAFRRVDLDRGRRGGVLTHGSVLTVTSSPTRTSPVLRGKWILENILGTPPPPPPANVPDLPDEAGGELRGTLRQRMEQHRSNAVCASCHKDMDPLGFALENFDAIGRWRERDGEHPIDASGELPGGAKFNGPAELRKLLKRRGDAFRRNLAAKLFTYALGRGLEPYDRCAVEQIAAKTEAGDDRFSSLVLAIVESDPFLLRRGEQQERE